MVNHISLLHFSIRLLLSCHSHPFFYKIALKSQKHISDKLIRKDTGLTVGQRNLNWDRREGTTFLISSLFSAVSKMQNQQKNERK